MLQLQHCSKKYSVDKQIKLFDGKFDGSSCRL